MITVSGISKTYALEHLARENTLKGKLGSLFRKKSGKDAAYLSISKTEAETFHALKDVSFSLGEGESLGLLGRNGSGKSTLLKIMSRVIAPSSGEIRYGGRMAALLEVGTGFHPELTGRENIFLNGAILGIPQKIIRKRFDSIVDFSEVEAFLDTPVKHYSSGMYVKLAYAVAAHVQPDILIVDEVLAVGDEAFQQKCIASMKDLVAGGATLLFVSHNYNQFEELCSKTLWLDKGTVVEMATDVPRVIADFRAKLALPKG